MSLASIGYMADFDCRVRRRSHPGEIFRLNRGRDPKITDRAALLPGRWAAEMEPVAWRHERRHHCPSQDHARRGQGRSLALVEVALAISEWIGDDLDLK
jgi:hypothetical protein